MRHPLRLGLLALALTVPAGAEEDPVLAALPEDIPGGREAAAQDLRSGVPQLVSNRLQSILLDHSPPRFEAWMPALDGRATREARDALSECFSFQLEREWHCREFLEASARWLEARTDITGNDAAKIAWGMRVPSAVLAERLKEPARSGDMYALSALCGNSEGHEFLRELLVSDMPESRRTQIRMGAGFTQSEAFRTEYERWMKSGDPISSFAGLNALLRIGDPKDLELARTYLRSPNAIRRMEVYRSVAWIKDPGVVDLLLEECERALSDTNQTWLAQGISRIDDPRALPFLRKMRDHQGFQPGVLRGLWSRGRAGDVPWLLEVVLAEDSPEISRREALRTLRKLIGPACPLGKEGREAAVRAWIAAHAAAIERDEALPVK
ncbi:MAG: HEAT repeat domain-containing protein [Candidatus Brocadiae bacterium]|nr:HEAT repeat domain-containing protein [Candidatus Brocadiia bacterium]